MTEKYLTKDLFTGNKNDAKNIHRFMLENNLSFLEEKVLLSRRRTFSS